MRSNGAIVAPDRLPRMRYSLAGKLALLSVFLVTLTAVLVVTLITQLQSIAPAILLTLAIIFPIVVIAAKYFARPLTRTLQAMNDGIASMKDGDFSISISVRSRDELGMLVASYNGLGELLRTERQSLYQRELLLDTVIQAAPLSIVLTNSSGRVVYSNLAARQVFLSGAKLEGCSFTELLRDIPEPLRLAITGNADTLFTAERAGESDTYYVSQRRFLLHSQPHHLYMLKRLTRELSRQEVNTWKKVIRVIAHELNNSLAPISSLAHSGRQMVSNPQPAQLERIFSTIEDRARHLHGFIDGYARFAKLPRPRQQSVSWKPFLDSLRQAVPFHLIGSIPLQEGVFDPVQIEQVLINLLKNAQEAGATEESIEINIEERAGGIQIQVLDRGSGMNDELLQNVLLPFYSTKPAGAGLGLTLCREIIEAHGGRMSFANRIGGGLVVTLWIPSPPEQRKLFI